MINLIKLITCLQLSVAGYFKVGDGVIDYEKQTKVLLLRVFPFCLWRV